MEIRKKKCIKYLVNADSITNSMHSHLMLFIVASLAIKETTSHGILMNPIGRGSIWRIDETFPKNYDDDQQYCGGYSTQWSKNKGKCGICGDSYSDLKPRDHENLGIYGLGKIVAEYKEGSVLDAAVLITANHRGYFNFSLCPLENAEDLEEEKCFIPLNLNNGNDKFYLLNTNRGYFNVTIQLPEGIKCEQCVFRWQYTTGNMWGDCGNGTQTVGCGPQETFRNCADIKIF